jgi:hypothetical protein
MRTCTSTRKHVAAAVVAATACLLAGTVTASASPPVGSFELGQCMWWPNYGIPHPELVTRGLAVNAVQWRALADVISRRWAWPTSKPLQRDLEGIAWLSADMKREILRQNDARIAAKAADYGHPLGWPCKPFVHPATSIRWIKNLLVDNGYRPGVTVTLVSPRRIYINGYQHGVEMHGLAVRSGDRQTTIFWSGPTPRSGNGPIRFAVRFKP